MISKNFSYSGKITYKNDKKSTHFLLRNLRIQLYN